MAQRPYYRLCDWRPEAGPLEDWLAAWAKDGWVPEFAPPYEGPWVSVGGRPEVMRWSMVRAGTFADRWADQRAEQADLGPAQVPPSSARSLLGPSTDQHQETPTVTDSERKCAGQAPEGPS